VVSAIAKPSDVEIWLKLFKLINIMLPFFKCFPFLWLCCYYIIKLLKSASYLCFETIFLLVRGIQKVILKFILITSFMIIWTYTNVILYIILDFWHLDQYFSSAG
jgi:hypothetical protein